MTWSAYLVAGVAVALVVVALAPAVLPAPWGDLARRGRGALLGAAAVLGGLAVGLVLTRARGGRPAPPPPPLLPPDTDGSAAERATLDVLHRAEDRRVLEVRTPDDAAAEHTRARERWRRGGP